jgi:cytochrome c peroxidase
MRVLAILEWVTTTTTMVCLVFMGCDSKRGSDAGAVTTQAAPTATATSPETPSSSGLPRFDPNQRVHFAPIPETAEKPVLDEMARLGQLLYFDVRLSRGQDVACASCHDLSRAGADGEAHATGTKKRAHKRNTPTVFNAGGAFAQGSDAAAATIEDFVPPHVADEAVMDMGEGPLVETLASIPAYAAAFKKAFADEKPPLSAETFGRAVAAFTKKLFTRSRWDRYLAGENAAVTEAELGGLAMFVEAGCVSCHQGKYLGATQSQKLGNARPWPPPTGLDPGRFAVTKQASDRGMFKVPSLRNVARTGPWLHDGSVATLEETTRLMARYQVGRELTDPQIQAIVTFLGALTGEPPKELTVKPTLPGGGPKTHQHD